MLPCSSGCNLLKLWIKVNLKVSYPETQSVLSGVNYMLNVVKSKDS